MNQIIRFLTEAGQPGAAEKIRAGGKVFFEVNLRKPVKHGNALWIQFTEGDVFMMSAGKQTDRTVYPPSIVYKRGYKGDITPARRAVVSFLRAVVNGNGEIIYK